MNEEKAFLMLQDLLALAEQLRDSGRYSADEICDEIRNRLDE